MDGNFSKWWQVPLFAVVVLLMVLARRWPVVLVGVIVVLLLAGCAHQERIVEVPVAVPVACQVAEPLRPVLGIDTMPPDLPIDEQARNLRADHDLRDGYEGELRAALKACRTIGGSDGR